MRSVLEATIEELGQVGFAALTIEEVARRAGVNKTTVYRRWPTKPALVQAAFERFGAGIALPDTGTLAGDIFSYLTSKVTLCKTARGRALIRGLMAEAFAPDMMAISKRLHAQEREIYRAMVAKARARGEAGRDLDADLLMQVIEGALSTRFLLEGKLATPREIKRLLELVLRGALR